MGGDISYDFDNHGISHDSAYDVAYNDHCNDIDCYRDWNNSENSYDFVDDGLPDDQNNDDNHGADLNSKTSD